MRHPYCCQSRVNPRSVRIASSYAIDARSHVNPRVTDSHPSWRIEDERDFHDFEGDDP